MPNTTSLDINTNDTKGKLAQSRKMNNIYFYVHKKETAHLP